MVTQIVRKQAKNGDLWAIVTVEDLEASVEVLLFKKAYDAVALRLATDTVVKIRGRVRLKEEAVEITGQEVTMPEIRQGPTGPVVISLPVARCTPPLVEQLRTVLASHPGVTEVRLRLVSASKATVWKLGEGLRVTMSQPLMADLKALLGPASVSV